MKAFFAFVFMACASSSFAQGEGPKPLEDDFLDLVVGKWVVSGTTHGLSVPQTLQADWMLNHQYVRIDQKTNENRPGWGIPFEAVHFIGYDRTQKRYVLHSLNVMGSSAPAVIYGERQGNAIKFEASAGQRMVGLRMTWRPESGTWHFVWGFQPDGGQWQAVTDLVLARSK